VRHAVEQRREARDARGEHHASGPHDPAGFGERADPVLPLEEVVERPAQQHEIDGRVRVLQPTGITERRRERCRERTATLARLLHVTGNWVDDVHPVAVGREPLGVHAGSAADVEDPPGRLAIEVAADELLCAEELDPAGASPQSLVFGSRARRVVPEHVVVEHWMVTGSHRPRLRPPTSRRRSRIGAGCSMTASLWNPAVGGRHRSGAGDAAYTLGRDRRPQLDLIP